MHHTRLCDCFAVNCALWNVCYYYYYYYPQIFSYSVLHYVRLFCKLGDVICLWIVSNLSEVLRLFITGGMHTTCSCHHFNIFVKSSSSSLLAWTTWMHSATEWQVPHRVDYFSQCDLMGLGVMRVCLYPTNPSVLPGHVCWPAVHCGVDCVFSSSDMELCDVIDVIVADQKRKCKTSSLSLFFV